MFFCGTSILPSSRVTTPFYPAGTYWIECRTDVPTTVHLSIHKDWGLPNQSTRSLTFFSDFTESRSVAELEFAFRPAE